MLGKKKKKEKVPAARSEETEQLEEEETFFWEELVYGPTDNKDPLDMLFFIFLLVLHYTSCLRFIPQHSSIDWKKKEGVSPSFFCVLFYSTVLPFLTPVFLLTFPFFGVFLLKRYKKKLDE